MQYSDTRSFAAHTLNTYALLQFSQWFLETNIKTVNCQLSNQRYDPTAVLQTAVQYSTYLFNCPVKCTKFHTGQNAKLQSVTRDTWWAVCTGLLLGTTGRVQRWDGWVTWHGGTYIHTYIHTYINTYKHKHTYTYINTHTYINTYTHRHIHKYIQT